MRFFALECAAKLLGVHHEGEIQLFMHLVKSPAVLHVLWCNTSADLLNVVLPNLCAL